MLCDPPSLFAKRFLGKRFALYSAGHVRPHALAAGWNLLWARSRRPLGLSVFGPVGAGRVGTEGSGSLLPRGGDYVHAGFSCRGITHYAAVCLEIDCCLEHGPR
jgi:hypothetical protein